MRLTPDAGEASLALRLQTPACASAERGDQWGEVNRRIPLVPIPPPPLPGQLRNRPERPFPGRPHQILHVERVHNGTPG